MGEDPGAVSTRALDEQRTAQQQEKQQPEDPAELRADIERTRQDLGDTVAALAEKTDVKARAKDKVSEVRQNVTDKKTELMGKARESSPDGANSAAVQVRSKAQENPVPTAALAAFVGGFLFGRITKRR
jgi:chromosome segregation ATPase